MTGCEYKDNILRAQTDERISHFDYMVCPESWLVGSRQTETTLDLYDDCISASMLQPMRPFVAFLLWIRTNFRSYQCSSLLSLPCLFWPLTLFQVRVTISSIRSEVAFKVRWADLKRSMCDQCLRRSDQKGKKNKKTINTNIILLCGSTSSLDPEYFFSPQFLATLSFLYMSNFLLTMAVHRLLRSICVPTDAFTGRSH